jgi:hypothetical protein
MARPLLIADPENATIEELKQVCRVGCNETAKREASHSDSATYQAFLDEADKSISFQRTTNILIMDHASWHKPKTTNWHNWQPMYCRPIRPTSTL